MRKLSAVKLLCHIFINRVTKSVVTKIEKSMQLIQTIKNMFLNKKKQPQ
jgi:hypothetical protein